MKTRKLCVNLTFVVLLCVCLCTLFACENKKDATTTLTPEDALVGTWKWDAADGYVIFDVKKSESAKTFAMVFSNGNTFKGTWTTNETNVFLIINKHNGKEFSNTIKYDYVVSDGILILTDDDDVMTFYKQ